MKLFFALGFFLSLPVVAATGTGHAQAELSTPLTVTGHQDINFGTIAIDPGASGPQVVSMTEPNPVNITCPSSYVCSGSPVAGGIMIDGAANTPIHVDISGSAATLSDGNGNTILFDPLLYMQSDSFVHSFPTGHLTWWILGDIHLTGDEPAGIYSSKNPGGTGYQITVNY